MGGELGDTGLAHGVGLAAAIAIVWRRGRVPGNATTFCHAMSELHGLESQHPLKIVNLLFLLVIANNNLTILLEGLTF